MEGWHQDGATGLAPDDGGAGAVAGKLARRTAIQSGAERKMILQPKFGIFQQDKLFPSGT